MIILKINDLPESLRFKRSEWGCAAAMTGFGWILLQSYETFKMNPSFVVMRNWADEETWGTLTLGLGALSLGTMIYNGRWKQFPRARVILAGARSIVWSLITWGLIRNGMASPGVAAFGAFFLMDVHAVYTAAHDARVIEEDRERHGAI